MIRRNGRPGRVKGWRSCRSRSCAEGSNLFRLNPRSKTMTRPLARVLVLSVLLAATGCAQTPGKAPEQLGKVQFQNSCSPAVQEKLLRGIAMLHSFYYSAAQKAFEEVAAEDNSCTIAAWGYASILMLNPLQASAPRRRTHSWRRPRSTRPARWARRPSASTTT